jgi:hypothetical protein
MCFPLGMGCQEWAKNILANFLTKSFGCDAIHGGITRTDGTRIS